MIDPPIDLVTPARFSANELVAIAEFLKVFEAELLARGAFEAAAADLRLTVFKQAYDATDTVAQAKLRGHLTGLTAEVLNHELDKQKHDIADMRAIRSRGINTEEELAVFEQLLADVERCKSRIDQLRARIAELNNETRRQVKNDRLRTREAYVRVKVALDRPPESPMSTMGLGGTSRMSTCGRGRRDGRPQGRRGGGRSQRKATVKGEASGGLDPPPERLSQRSGLVAVATPNTARLKAVTP